MLLAANLANTKWWKNPEEWLKLWRIGTHLRVLSRSYLMNTNMIGFRWFSKIFASNWKPIWQGFNHFLGFLHHFVLAKLVTDRRVNGKNSYRNSVWDYVITSGNIFIKKLNHSIEKIFSSLCYFSTVYVHQGMRLQPCCLFTESYLIYWRHQ